MVTLKESLITKDSIKNVITDKNNYLVACIDIGVINKEILNYLSEYYVCQNGISKRIACYVMDEKDLIRFMRKHNFYNLSVLKPITNNLTEAEVKKLIQGDKRLQKFTFYSKTIEEKAKDRTYKV